MSEETHAAVTLTDANFEEEVLNFPGLVLVDFWAAWCGPCIAMAPIVEKLAAKYADNAQVKVAKLDVDAQMETSQAYRILSLPTFKVFIGGQAVSEMVGASNEVVLEKMITDALPQLAVKKAA